MPGPTMMKLSLRVKRNNGSVNQNCCRDINVLVVPNIFGKIYISNFQVDHRRSISGYSVTTSFALQVLEQLLRSTIIVIHCVGTCL